MSGKHAAVDPRTLGHDHKAVQFRDGKEPHCKTCGLTADGRTPASRLHPAGNPSTPTTSFPAGPEPSVEILDSIVVRPGVDIDPGVVARDVLARSTRDLGRSVR